jgi:hypothetical protein
VQSRHNLAPETDRRQLLPAGADSALQFAPPALHTRQDPFVGFAMAFRREPTNRPH